MLDRELSPADSGPRAVVRSPLVEVHPNVMAPCLLSGININSLEAERQFRSPNTCLKELKCHLQASGLDHNFTAQTLQQRLAVSQSAPSCDDSLAALLQDG